jgi:predicted secreted hydrolase
MKKIIFPKDEQAHKNIIEWWYWNGHLKGEDGRDYSFMNCLFKADSKRVKLPFLKSPFKNIYFSHFILSDVSRQNFFSDIDYIVIPSRQSFKRPLLFVEYIAAEPETFFKGFVVNLMKEKKPFVYRIKTKSFDLELKSQKSPFLEGGSGFLNLHGRKTYYYSLTSLAVEGEIFLKNKTVKVKGRAWMDHQWANAPYSQDLWTWFSIQLNNKTELIVFEYGHEKKDCYAGICLPDGRQEHFGKVKISPLDRGWKSARTGAVYNLSWRIEIPEKKIILKTEPLIKKQEMIFGAINYWEGPLKIFGKINNKKISGRGFMELVGRSAKHGSLAGIRNILFDELKKNLKKSLKK